MEDQNIQLEHLLSEVAARNRRAFRRSMIFSVLALVAGAAWLFYSFNQVKKLEVKSSELRREIDEKTADLSEKEKEVQEAKAALLAINPLLEKYGVLKGKLTADNISSSLVKQSLEANQEIDTASSTSVGRRRGVTVEYYLKGADAGKVLAALNDLGFMTPPQIKSPHRPNDPTDLVAFGSSVNPEDAKLVTYTLIRAGVEIKGMCRASLKPSSIQVMGDNRFQDRPAMTVDQVRRKTEFQVCPDYPKPLPNDFK